MDEVYVNGSMEHRLPGNLNMSFAFVEGESLLMGINDIAVSSGSACTSKSLKASHVLLAMGIDHATAQGSVVFSLIEETTAADVDFVLAEFPPIIGRLRGMSPLYTEFLKERGS